MSDFERIRILIQREKRLREAADYLQPRERLLALADECQKRAKHLFWDAKHEAYNEGRRKSRPTYRKTFTG